MANDLDIIKKIGKTIRKKLKPISLEKIIYYYSNGYVMDGKGFVIGLNLDKSEISDLLIIAQLTRLTHLQLGRNKISNVSPLQGLTALKYLNLSSNQLTDVSPLQGLTALTTLDLRSNQLTDVSPLQRLTALTELYLHGNQLTDVSPLQRLTALTELYLHGNQLTDVSPLQRLTALTQLDLASNQLTDVSPLQRLTALTQLDLASNQLTDVSPLQRLTALTTLDLRYNRLTDVSPLQRLTALTQLDLASNQLTDVSPLQGLTALTELYLHSNQLTDVSPLQGLKQLKTLDLMHNKITQLPEAIFHLDLEVTWESDSLGPGLHLYGNPLETPPVEVVKQGKAAILNYFKELTDSVRLLQCKLLIVGNGEVGKTTLMKKLIDNHFQVQEGKEESTHGIHIKPWQLEVPFQEKEKEIIPQTVNLHFWDFGGQDIYHATHQFFLTKRSLYLFVWEVRREEETRSFDYWLNILKLLSDQSPVIIVMNKSDARTKFIDEKAFKTKFPNIQAYHKISCLKGNGIQELTAEIRQNLARMPHLRDKLPRVWLQIRDHLHEEKTNQNYIPLATYFSICKTFGLNEERALFLSEYLHDLGVIIHYGNDPQLRDTVILNPEWATEALYILIDTREIQEKHGNFCFNDLKKYWDHLKYPEEKHWPLMRLMERFELCFNFADTSLFFIPELLPPAEESLDLSPFQPIGTLRFQYHYDFMPEGIVSRFMARFFYLIEAKKWFWKNGVILKYEDSRALVTGEPLNRRVAITITGTKKKELLAIIRHHLDFIHDSLNMEKNNHYDEKIPCICKDCLTSDTPHFYKYDKLKQARDKHIHSTSCQNSFETVAIGSLLEGFDPPEIKGHFVDTLMRVVAELQALATTIRSDEDSRNGYISSLLPGSGYMTKDQTRAGVSATGLSSGRLDIKVFTPNGEPVAIIEALRLPKFDSNYISSHVHKIFDYDANGLAHNFIVVYAEAEDFGQLWQKYLGYLPRIDYRYQRLDTGIPPDKSTPYADIRLTHTRHDRHGKETVLYHLFVKMPRKKD